jgi:CRISPR-associated endoribonuclease Cas6
MLHPCYAHIGEVMRIKLTLCPIDRNATLPVNYNYFLTGLIYRIIASTSTDYSRFLHDEGYKVGESKNGFKLFVYSMLMDTQARVKSDKISFSGNSLTWNIASPVPDFIQHLVTGVFAEGQEIHIGPKISPVRFRIEQVETLAKPQFSDTMRFTCLSPITVSQSPSLNRLNSLNSSNRSSGSAAHYLRPWEEGFSDAIKNNLLKKYFLIHGKNLDNSTLSITLDSDYMNKRAGKIIKNIRFKETNIIGFLAPFEVTGSPELIQIGYEAGFGEKGSMGFGMVKVRV